MVNDKLDIIYFNKRAEEMHPTSRLPDGLRMLLSPVDCEEVIRLISLGDSFSCAPSVLSRFPTVAFSFSPYLQDGRYAGAYVVLSPIVEHPDSSMDLRQSLLSASSLVVAREFKKCVSEIFYSLSACVSKLKIANIDIIDEQLRAINRSCYQIMRNTSNVSERIQYASNLEPTLQCIDFWDNCAELFEACSTVLRARQAAFTYELPETTVYVNCDFDKITTAVLHLISNAYLHCQSDVQVTIVGRDTADGILLTVSDNGPGIATDIQGRIFQPFSWGCADQQDETMGLGLNNVRNIIAQAGGKLAMNSGDSGTTMALSLPRTEAPDAVPQLCSTSATYMQDRFSSLYVLLSGVISPPDP
ncbi:MAG: HAMP domain-containing sensor histidine kinase [Angelakisella sp.]